MTSFPVPCDGCRNGEKFEIPISMAFQPIVSVAQKRVFAHEALLRCADGGGAGAVFERVDDDTRYAFDRVCRTTAITMAAALDLPRDGALLSINFLRSDPEGRKPPSIPVLLPPGEIRPVCRAL